MTTGERIKNRRKELGISADKLAELIGVSRSQCSDMKMDILRSFQ